MNKKSTHTKPSQPARKTMPAAVHAAALALEHDDTGVSETPLVVEHVADTPAPATAPASVRAEKPGKPVTFSLTLPGEEAHRFDALREAHQQDGVKPKKSIVLRAALIALAELDQGRAAQIIAGLQPPAEDKPKSKPHKAKSKK